MALRVVESHAFKQILSEFPRQMKFCFAYGSGAFKQMNNQASMLDLVFVVSNAEAWHAENQMLNPRHYAQPMKFLGPKAIAKVQEQWGAKIYYNTLIDTAEGQKIKYGVISEVSLVEDLLDWNDLYLAGRLHKPVKVVIEPKENSQLHTALVQNLHSAVHAALLLLPDNFQELDFYKTIAGLSYNGDFRMIFGENKDKVNNIVIPQLLQFRKVYKPILTHFEEYIDIPTDITATCQQDTSPATKIYHLNHLPRIPQVKLVKIWSGSRRLKDTEDCLRAIAYDPECSQILEECLKSIVLRSSVTQSVKGIVTAGLMKSIKYGGAKIKKMFVVNADKQILPGKDKFEKIITTVVKKDSEPKDAGKRIQ